MPIIDDIPHCTCGARRWRWTGIVFYSDPPKHEARCLECRRIITVPGEGSFQHDPTPVHGTEALKDSSCSLEQRQRREFLKRRLTDPFIGVFTTDTPERGYIFVMEKTPNSLSITCREMKELQLENEVGDAFERIERQLSQ